MRHRTRTLRFPYEIKTNDDRTGIHREYPELEIAQAPAKPESFVQEPSGYVVRRTVSFVPSELPNLHWAFGVCFRDWRLSRAGGYKTSAVELERIETSPGVFESFEAGGTLYFHTPDGSRRAIRFSREPPFELLSAKLTFYAAASDQEQLEREFDQFCRWLHRHHYRRGQVIRPNGDLIVRRESADWPDVILPPQTEVAVRANTEGLLRLRRHYRRNQMPLKRGIILHGPPGTGKTLIGKALANSGMASLIWITAADIKDPEEVRRLFELARRLRPTILFFEDFDLFAGARRYDGGRVLGELLVQLDGFESSDGLIAVATTNDLKLLDPAVRDRPSRFDVVLEIGLPNREVRRRMFRHFWRAQQTSDEIIELAAGRSDRLSGAQIREVAFFSVQSAIQAGRLDDSGKAILDEESILAGLDRFCRARRVIGFAAAAAISNGHPDASHPRT
jgi:hypothetical protein